MYVVGETTGDAHFSFVQGDGVKPFDLDVAQMFGHSPKTIMDDETVERHYEDAHLLMRTTSTSISQRVLQLEAVACKDWLTNKVDRSVTGKIARQQCQGEIQLPLSDCGVVALDYRGKKGIATALGHAPQAGLAAPEAGSVLSVAEPYQYRLGTLGRRSWTASASRPTGCGLAARRRVRTRALSVP